MGILVYSLISVVSVTVPAKGSALIPGVEIKFCLVVAVVDGFPLDVVVVVESVLAELDHVGRLVGSLGNFVVDVVTDSFVTVLVW